MNYLNNNQKTVKKKLYIVENYNVLCDYDSKNLYFLDKIAAEKKLYSIAKSLAKHIQNNDNLKKSDINEYHIYPYYLKLLENVLIE